MIRFVEQSWTRAVLYVCPLRLEKFHSRSRPSGLRERQKQIQKEVFSANIYTNRTSCVSARGSPLQAVEQILCLVDITRVRQRRRFEERFGINRFSLAFLLLLRSRCHSIHCYIPFVHFRKPRDVRQA